MSDLEHTESVVISRAPAEVYAMVSDVTRTGEWSPICRVCWWDEGAGPEVGAWFTGRNELPERTWETRSQVVTADPGREFAFVVGGAYVRWGYTMREVDGGTELTESWEFLPSGLDRFVELYGDDAQRQIEMRTQDAKRSIPATLSALKVAAESA